jgi:hypothetical protein
MSRRTNASLVVLLLLTSIAPAAHAAPSAFSFDAQDFFAHAWNFLDRIWAPAVASANPGESRGGIRAIWANNGMCIDPDGRPAGASCAGAQVFRSDGGSCIDPNGRPGAVACADLLGSGR